MMTVPKWVLTALPIAGLAIVPLAGLVYVSTASFGKPASSASPSASASSLTVPIHEDELPNDPVVGKRSTTPKVAKPSGLFPNAGGLAGGREKDAATKLCCEKLSDLAQNSDVGARASYSAAAAACNAAPSSAGALKQVASILDGHEVPSECEKR
jgi:hypothetical protein